MSEIIAWASAHLTDILIAVSAVVAAASAIANLTPTETDNKVVAAIAKVVNFLALNWKKPA